jgi:hypothetical protein
MKDDAAAEIVRLSFVLSRISVGIARQKRQLAAVDQVQKQCDTLRQQAIKKSDEQAANHWWGLCQILSAAREALEMTIALKELRPSEAWHHFVSSEAALDNAIESGTVGLSPELLKSWSDYLEAVEEAFFPSQVFQSAGVVIARDGVICSICGQKYDECDHIVKRIYMGKQCIKIITKIIRFDHSAFVKVPADKSCRVETVNLGAEAVDTLTLE